MQENYDYDVIIIGAGISGLVCGCYLAKAGLKTLIVEKNAKPGGYCTSFVSKGFHFDACAHTLSSLRKGGLLDRFLKELEIRDRLEFNRYNPSDVIVTPDFKINIFHEVDKTIEEFQKYFPRDKNRIEKFFRYIDLSDSFLNVRNKTFDELLNSYFEDERLKYILSFLGSVLVGIASSRLSALVACLLYKEFIFDGGYYPVGGMQALPDCLLKRFNEFGGDIILNKMVKKIKVENNKAKGIILNDSKYISSKYTVSACDARQTFIKLVGQNKLNPEVRNNIMTTDFSSSAFIVYLGVNKNLKNIPELKSNIFLFSGYKNCYTNCYTDILNWNKISFRAPSVWEKTLNKNGKESLCLSIEAKYRKEDYWSEQRRRDIADRLISLFERYVSVLSKYIELRITATPHTLYKWTGNHHGAGFGWSSTPGQFGNPDFSQKTSIENLYLTGHWSNQSSGIGLVANCGRDAAVMILNKQKRKV